MYTRKPGLASMMARIRRAQDGDNNWSSRLRSSVTPVQCDARATVMESGHSGRYCPGGLSLPRLFQTLKWLPCEPGSTDQAIKLGTNATCCKQGQMGRLCSVKDLVFYLLLCKLLSFLMGVMLCWHRVVSRLLC